MLDLEPLGETMEMIRVTTVHNEARLILLITGSHQAHGVEADRTLYSEVCAFQIHFLIVCT